MVIYDEQVKSILKEEDCDLTIGCLVPTKKLKDNIQPIDNITKFVYTDEDTEDIFIYTVYQTKEDYKNQQINILKEKLAATDYVVIKIAEGAATAEEYAAVIADREAWRKEINELEGDNEL